MTLSTPADFVRAIRAHDIEPAVFCTHLLHTATSGNGTVTPEQTAAEFDIHRDAAERLHSLATEFGLVTYTATQTDRVRVNRRRVSEFLPFIDAFGEYVTETELELLADGAIHDVELTVAVPEDFDGRSSDLTARLIRLVKNAETDILVVTPFFTRFGVDAFVNHLAQATNRGVEVTILTRDASGVESNADHVDSIKETVSNSGIETNLSIFDYSAENGRLHAKALITDTETAYVGSANMTNYSLKEAIELGLIVKGPVVQEISDFFETVRLSPDTGQIDT